jgi:hypothetical protein
MDEPIVKWPFGDASELALTASGTQDLEVVNELTIVDGASVVATDARTINITVDEAVGAGAMLLFKLKTTATETTTFGTNITAADIEGVAGKTFTVLFMYDGSGFVPVGEPTQID